MLVTCPFGRALDTEADNDRLYQIGWYAMGMIGFITNQFEGKELLKCNVKTFSEEENSEGVLYIIPLNKKYLVLNLQQYQNA